MYRVSPDRCYGWSSVGNPNASNALRLSGTGSCRAVRSAAKSFERPKKGLDTIRLLGYTPSLPPKWWPKDFWFFDNFIATLKTRTVFLVDCRGSYDFRKGILKIFFIIKSNKRVR